MKFSPPNTARCVGLLMVLSCLALSLPPSMRAQPRSAAPNHSLALVGGTVYPAPFERPIPNSVVLLENGKIIAVGEKEKLQIPPGVQTIDCTGHTIVAGFWNSHVHFTEPKWQNAASLPPTQLTKQLQEMLTRYGFTSVVDTGSLLPNTLAVKARIESAEVEHWNDSTVAPLKAANVSLIPTLTLFSGENGPDAAHEGIFREVKSYSDAGGQILFGTDVGYLTDYPLLTKEFELLHRPGLTFDQILAALTTAPASRFGFAEKTGRVAVGQDADLVVLNDDPTRDVTAFSRVALTVRLGNIIYREPTMYTIPLL